MRIVLVNHEYPPLGGGAATATYQLAKALVDEGNDVLVVTSSGPGCPAEEVDGRLRVVRLSSLRRSRFAPRPAELLSFCLTAAGQLTEQIRNFRADGVIAFFAVPAGFFAVRSARELGLPVIVSLRGSDVPGFSRERLGGLYRCLAEPLIRYTLSRADYIAPNNQHLADLALRWKPSLADKIRLLPNAVTQEQIAGRPARSADNTLRLITVGQLVRRKRIDWLLATLVDLTRQNVDARLTIVGEGPQTARLRALADTGELAGKVQFTGYLERAEITQLLQRHDVYVTPSRAEGMSHAVLEAMAAGLPIVTNANGCHDVVRKAKCGIVTKHDHVGALTEAVLQLASDRTQRHAYGLAALRFARTLGWRSSAARLEGMLREAGQGATVALRSAEPALRGEEPAALDVGSVLHPSV